MKNSLTIIRNKSNDPGKPGSDPAPSPEKGVPLQPVKTPDPNIETPKINNPEKINPAHVEKPNVKSLWPSRMV